MEDEGEIVYFETSPALENLRVLENETIGDHHMFQEGLNDNPNIDRRVLKHTKWWSIFNPIKKYFIAKWQSADKHHIKTLLGCIKNSPLLTDEDSQLLAFVLNYSDKEYQAKNNTENPQTNYETDCHITHETESQITHKTDSQTSHETDSQTAHRNFLILNYYSVAVISGVLSVLWVLCGPVISGCGLLGLVFIWLLIEQMYKFQRRQSESLCTHVSSYLCQTEKLLCILTQSINTIQEREIVYHGFDRPSVGVPMNRLEFHISKYQCLPLRKQIFQACQEGVWLMRSVTRVLVNNYTINLELDNRQSYIAFRNLSDLHEYLSVKWEAEEEKPVPLSLESLKTAASLFAVINSEMIKRLALVIASCSQCFAVTTPRMNVLYIRQVSSIVSEIHHFVSRSIHNLQWSLEFEQHHLLSQDHITSTSSPDSIHSTPLSFIELRLHAADVQTQTTLIKIRELQTSLKTSTHDDEVTTDEVKAVLNNLESAERHLKEIKQFLIKKANSDVRDHKVVSEESQDEEEEDSVIKEEKEEEEEEEEKVYEALVTKVDKESHDYQEESNEYFQSQRQVSVHVMQELNSVLAVRKVEKERKLEEKAKRKIPCDSHMTSSDNDTPSCNKKHVTTLEKSSHDHEKFPNKSHDCHVIVNQQTENITRETEVTGTRMGLVKSSEEDTGMRMGLPVKLREDVTRMGMGLVKSGEDSTGMDSIAKAIARVSKAHIKHEDVFEEDSSEEDYEEDKRDKHPDDKDYPEGNSDIDKGNLYHTHLDISTS